MYKKLDNGTMWPVYSEKSGDCQWRLVHGQFTDSDRMYASSVMSAYWELINLPVRERNKVIAEFKKVVNE